MSRGVGFSPVHFFGWCVNPAAGIWLMRAMSVPCEPMTLIYRHFSPNLDPDVCISVDGDAPGRLQLSHWPGNRTPAQFKHDLSTGACLTFMHSPQRLSLLPGLTTVTNTHWDTDGACAVYSMLRPIEALRHADVLLAAALAGDMSLYTTPEGTKLELTLTALSKHPESPVQSGKFTDDLERRQAQYDYAMDLIPQVIAKPDLHYAWWGDEHKRIHRDLRALREEEATLDHYAALDFSVISTDRPLHEVAVNTAAWSDRILTIEQLESGAHKYELRLSTFSWFEQPTRGNLPRPNWQPLLDALVSQAPSPDGHWRANDLSEPTPKLCFVGANDALCASAANPALVKRLVLEFYSKHPFLPAGF